MIIQKRINLFCCKLSQAVRGATLAWSGHLWWSGGWSQIWRPGGGITPDWHPSVKWVFYFITSLVLMVNYEGIFLNYLRQTCGIVR